MSMAETDRSPRVLSLRAQLAIVMGTLSALPTLLALVILVSQAPVLSREAWIWLAVAASGGIVMAALAGFLLSRQLLLPLTRVTSDVAVLPATVARLASARLPILSDDPDEIARLKGSFNALLAQVQQEQSRRGAFMATVMHDLKTPLLAMRNLLRTLQADAGMAQGGGRANIPSGLPDGAGAGSQPPLGAERTSSMLARITEENEALVDLVQRLVDAYRLERSDLSLERRSIRLHDVVAGVIERAEPLGVARGIEIRVQGESVVSADPVELGRALYNLIGNAVRYARSRIDVTVYPYLVRIEDDGPGLPLPLEELAQPFRSRAVTIAGTQVEAGTGGLGLFIARKILEGHGGRLVCERRGPQGTVLLAYVGRNRKGEE